MELETRIIAKFGHVAVDSLLLRHTVERDKVSGIVHSGVEKRLLYLPPVLVVSGYTAYRVLDGHHRVAAAQFLKKTLGYPPYLSAWMIEESEYAKLIQTSFDGTEPLKISAVRSYISCGNSDGNSYVDSWHEKAPRKPKRKIKVKRGHEPSAKIDIEVEISPDGDVDVSVDSGGLDIGISSDGLHAGLSNDFAGIEIDSDGLKVWAGAIDHETGIGVAVELPVLDTHSLRQYLEHHALPDPTPTVTTGYKSTYRDGDS